MLEIDLSFPHSYSVEEFRDLPGSGKPRIPVHYIPQPKTRPEHDGLWLKIASAEGNEWIGVFAEGYDSPPAITRVVTTPNPDSVCVISSGEAYAVNPRTPGSHERIGVMPVLDVRPILEQRLLIFSDFTSLAAYGPNGLVWYSPRVCWDNLKIHTITEATIEGTGFDPPSGQDRPFAVDIRTGQSVLPPPTSNDGKSIW